MKAMRTMIVIIDNRLDLEKEDQEHLKTCQIASNVYLTSKTPEETKYALYGVGYNSNEVLVSTLEKECYDTLKSTERIILK